MGVMTDFIVASKRHAKKIALMDVKSRCIKFHSEEIRGLDRYQLEVLYCILKQEDIQKPKSYSDELKFESYMNTSYPLLFQESENRPWIYQLPDGFVHTFANVETKALPQLARDWINTGTLSTWIEPKSGKVKDSTVLWALQMLHKLCSEALEQNVSVLMWICL